MNVEQEDAALLLWSSPAFAVTIALLCYAGVSSAAGVFDIFEFVETIESLLPPYPFIFFILYLTMGIGAATIKIPEQTSRNLVYCSVGILVAGFFIGVFAGISQLT
jgi:hypothetical protein